VGFLGVELYRSPRLKGSGRIVDMSKYSPPTEEEYETALTHQYKVGIYAGLKQAAGVLLEESRNYFTSEQDTTAVMIRDLSKRLQSAAEQAHPGTPA
jgi:hypothetical protein